MRRERVRQKLPEACGEQSGEVSGRHWQLLCVCVLCTVMYRYPVALTPTRGTRRPAAACRHTRLPQRRTAPHRTAAFAFVLQSAPLSQPHGRTRMLALPPSVGGAWREQPFAADCMRTREHSSQPARPAPHMTWASPEVTRPPRTMRSRPVRNRKSNININNNNNNKTSCSGYSAHRCLLHVDFVFSRDACPQALLAAARALTDSSLLPFQ